jgi:hypothetical protein
MIQFGYGKNKFKAKSGNGFASKLEEAVYNILLLRERAGEISDIKRQQSVVLQDGPQDERITWRIDFSFFDKQKNKTVYCEAKGVETSDYKIKLKLFKGQKIGDLEIYKGHYMSPKLVEKVCA